MTYAPKENILYKIKRGIKERLFGKGNYGILEKGANADRSAKSLGMLGDYLLSAAKRIEGFEKAMSSGHIRVHELEKLRKKEVSKIKNLEKAVADALAVILILGAVFLFSFSKDPITGYSIYTATSSLNYAIISGVILLLTSIFLIIKTHK